MIEVLSYITAIICGVLVSESMVFGDKQAVYKRNATTIQGQLKNYLLDRWDDLAKKVGLGLGLVLIVGNAVNTDGITSFLVSKTGLEGLSLSLSGSALCFILLAFGGLILQKVGLIKKED